MVQRINISISDELSEQLSKYKNSINVSGVCQKAIKSEIEKIEEFNARLSEDQNIEEIIRRLKKERAEQYSIFIKIGREDGYNWAKIAPYNDLMDVVNDKKLYGLLVQPSFYKFIQHKFSIDTEKDLKSYFKLREPNLDLTMYSEIEELYFQAATEGAKKFWNQISPLSPNSFDI